MSATVVWILAAVLVVVAATIGLALTHLAIRAPGTPSRLYARHFPHSRHERLFLAACSYFGSVVVIRAVTHAIRAGVGPFRNIVAGGVHVHHLVWGILLLLGIGGCWLAEFGIGERSGGARVTAVLYGIAAALPLDEFALWLRLEDVYWSPEGLASVHAVLLFGGLLAVATWGGRFLHAVTRESVQQLRQHFSARAHAGRRR